MAVITEFCAVSRAVDIVRHCVAAAEPQRHSRANRGVQTQTARARTSRPSGASLLPTPLPLVDAL